MGSVPEHVHWHQDSGLCKLTASVITNDPRECDIDG